MTTTSKRIRAGLYAVTRSDGETFMVENRYSDFGSTGEWLWFITSTTRNLWLDPTYTKAEALAAIGTIKAGLK